jgi:amphi-Trp domain-containing protein
MSHEFESELTGSRAEIAAVLDGVVDGLLTGSIRLGDGPDAVTVAAPDDISLEIEFESEGDELSLELELEWSGTDDGSTDTDDLAAHAGAADTTQSLARFEVFRDRADEWRWRLRHRNGNIIATSGEGYTRKHNAWKGLRSVMRNAPEAALTEDARTE